MIDIVALIAVIVWLLIAGALLAVFLTLGIMALLWLTTPIWR